MDNPEEKSMNLHKLRSPEVLSVIAAAGCGTSVWMLVFGLFFVDPNFAESLVGGLAGLSVAVIARPLVLQKLRR